MIYWNDYKKYKQMAERFLQIGDSKIIEIKIEILKFELKEITKDQAIENIINALSGGEHFKPL